MRIKVGKAAYFTCLAFTSFLMILVGSKGLGVAVPPGLEFWALQAMHLSFVVSFSLGLAEAVRSKRKAEAILLGIPLAAFAAALALSAARVRFPLPLLLVFDVYLIVACVLQLTRSGPGAALGIGGATPASAQRQEVPLGEAYALLNSGGVVLVCSRAPGGAYDIAPVAWNTPLEYDPVSRVLFVLDPGHQSFRNIEASGKFALALPTFAQKDLVLSTGSVSGRDTDKYAKFGIETSHAEEADALIPAAVAGCLECRVLEIRRIGTSAVIAAEIVRASAVSDAWRYRLHHAGGDIFYKPGERV